MEITSPTHSYGETVNPVAGCRLSFAFNDSHILIYQVGYCGVLLMSNHLYECEVGPLL